MLAECASLAVSISSKPLTEPLAVSDNERKMDSRDCYTGVFLGDSSQTSDIITPAGALDWQDTLNNSDIAVTVEISADCINSEEPIASLEATNEVDCEHLPQCDSAVGQTAEAPVAVQEARPTTRRGGSRNRRRGGGRLWQCCHTGCGVSFARRYSLQVHLRTHSDYPPLTCPSPGCTAAFYEQAKLNRHMQSHAEARLVCSTCGARFRQRSNLDRHVSRVHGVSSVSEIHCVVCRTAAASDAASCDHSSQSVKFCRAASPPEPSNSFRCQICGRQFTHAWLLKRHSKRGGCYGNGQLLYRCAESQCDFVAALRSDLSAHSRRVHERKHFHCPHTDCDWSFDCYAKLRRHQRQHARHSSNYLCPVTSCDKSYRRFEYLLTHLRKHDPSEQNAAVSGDGGESLPDSQLRGSGCSATSALQNTDLLSSECSLAQDIAVPRANYADNGGAGYERITASGHSEISHRTTTTAELPSRRELGGRLRALGVGRYPPYLRHLWAGSAAGNSGCARTSLVYCPPSSSGLRSGAANLSSPSSPTLAHNTHYSHLFEMSSFTSTSRNGAHSAVSCSSAAETGRLVNSAVFAVSDVNTERSDVADIWSEQTGSSHEEEPFDLTSSSLLADSQRSFGHNARLPVTLRAVNGGVCSQLNCSFSINESSSLMDSLCLLSDDMFHPTLTDRLAYSTINLDDLS